MTGDVRRTIRIHVRRGRRSSKVLTLGVCAPDTAKHNGRIPRITRLMALAIYLDRQIKEHTIKDYAQIARLGHVSRARVTQIMNLLNLAPDIQEAILFLPPTQKGRDPIREKMIRSMAAEAEMEWNTQRTRWRQCAQELSPVY